MFQRLIALVMLVICLDGCSGGCDEKEAMNKMLALGKVQGRLLAKGGEGLENFALHLSTESGAVSELIGQKKYAEACVKADEIAKKYEINLDKEQEGMITAEQLEKDGGKGSGRCSIADAAKRQMELHALLQKEVDAGRKSDDIFRQFGEDAKGYAEMLSTNPSAACDLFDKLQEKYGVK